MAMNIVFLVVLFSEEPQENQMLVQAPVWKVGSSWLLTLEAWLGCLCHWQQALLRASWKGAWLLLDSLERPEATGSPGRGFVNPSRHWGWKGRGVKDRLEKGLFGCYRGIWVYYVHHCKWIWLDALVSAEPSSRCSMWGLNKNGPHKLICLNA